MLTYAENMALKYYGHLTVPLGLMAVFDARGFQVLTGRKNIAAANGQARRKFQSSGKAK